MRITSAASALPRHYYPQKVLLQAFRKYWGPKIERFDVLERLHAATQVDGRYLTLPLERYPLSSWGEANNVWIEAAVDLGHEAICKGMQQGGTTTRDIGAFFFVSITGVASPS